jgi:hypothetical protein
VSSCPAPRSASLWSRRSDGTGGEREIGFVTTIAYFGFLIGPPMVGGLAHLTNLSFAIAFIGIIAMLMAPAALAAAAARGREQETDSRKQTTSDLSPKGRLVS